MCVCRGGGDARNLRHSWNSSDKLSKEENLDYFIHDDTLNFCRDLPGVPERRNAGELAVLPMQVQWEYQVHSPGMV